MVGITDNEVEKQKASTTQLKSHEKAFIGAAGGFSLVLLKLIDVGFFVGAPDAKILVGYLTYASYIVLGMIVATFLTDHELSIEKGRRQALIMGLLAPSILIAIITNPDSGKNYTSTTSSINSVPDLGFSFSLIRNAFAQEESDTPYNSEVKIKVIRKSDVDVGYRDAFLSVIGRKEIEGKFAFVVGSTNSSDRAEEVAKQLNSALECDKSKGGCAELVTGEGGGLVYVTVGGLQGIASANQEKLNSLQKLITSMKINPNQNTGKLATLVSKGKIVEGYEFLK